MDSLFMEIVVCLIDYIQNFMLDHENGHDLAQNINKTHLKEGRIFRFNMERFSHYEILQT